VRLCRERERVAFRLELFDDVEKQPRLEYDLDRLGRLDWLACCDLSRLRLRCADLRRLRLLDRLFEDRSLRPRLTLLKLPAELLLELPGNRVFLRSLSRIFISPGAFLK
jgi:hypothetical protein